MTHKINQAIRRKDIQCWAFKMNFKMTMMNNNKNHKKFSKAQEASSSVIAQPLGNKKVKVAA